MAKKKSKKKLYLFLGVMIVGAILLWAFVFSKAGNKNVVVTVSKVEKRTITQTVSAVGKIQAETEIKVSSETSGEIVFLGVHEGDTVKSGELLVRIKPDIIESQLEQFQAANEASRMEIEARKSEMERADAAFKRVKELFAKEFASKEEFDRAFATYNQAVSNYKASLSHLDQSLASYKQVKKSAERTTIFAPIHGVVTKLSVEKGEKVVGTAQMAGTEMMKVSDLNVMNAVVEIDENDIVNVKVGDTSEIEIDAFPDRVYKGVVLEIGHSAIVNQLGTQDQVTNFQVKVRIVDKEPRLRPGMSCNVDIRTNVRYNALAVPLQAVTVRDSSKSAQKVAMNGGDEGEPGKVIKDDSKTKSIVKRPPSLVFIRDGNKAKMKEVKTGISDNGFIEILEGLAEGEEIISGSFMTVSKTLQNGTIVKVDSVAKGKSGKTIKK